MQINRQHKESPMKDAAKQRKSELIDTLKMQILTLELRPGAGLDEARLCEAFSMSRTPLREVFRQLSGEGYLELRENRGARVSEMSHTTLRDFFLTAPMIYGAILKLAARNASADQISELSAAQEKFKAALQSGSGADRAMANNRFHEITGKMADNIYLAPSFRRLLIDHARIGMTFYRPNDKEMVDSLAIASQQHDAIIAAIKSGDETIAARLAVEHWNLSRNKIELFVMPAGLDMPIGTTLRKTPA